MRHRVTWFGLLALLLATAGWAAARVNATRVCVNGVPLREQGMVQNGVTYVPLRAVAEALGCTVNYDPKAGVFVWSASPQSPEAPQVAVPGPVPDPRPVPPRPPVPGAPRTGTGLPPPTGRR